MPGITWLAEEWASQEVRHPNFIARRWEQQVRLKIVAFNLLKAPDYVMRQQV